MPIPEVKCDHCSNLAIHFVRDVIEGEPINGWVTRTMGEKHSYCTIHYLEYRLGELEKKVEAIERGKSIYGC